MLALACAVVLLAVGSPSDGARADEDRRCPDNRGLAHFDSDDRLVMTYYYYWYDEESLANPAMAVHPPVGQPFDWRDPAWHRQQLRDMADVGVDVALAVYWGSTADWSTGGIDALVQARESLLRQHVRPPAIGVMLDTNLYATLLPERPELADLTSQDGISTFADLVHDVLSRIPPCDQARIDGRPLVFVWRADTEDGDRFRFDQRTLSSVEDLLDARLGVRPLFVFERTWIDHAVEANMTFTPEASFGWGAALHGPRFQDRSVAVGPGYDDRAIVERPGYVRDRDDGRTYARDLRAAVLSGRPWVLLETWNELWEGTAIGETKEYGRETLLATRQYVELFHTLDRAGVRDGWFDLGSGEGAYLRRLADAPQEEGQPILLDGRLGARAYFEEADAASYFHFAVDPRLGIGEHQPVVVDVEYFDEGAGSFYLEYDADDPAAPAEGRFTAARPVIYEDTGQWRAARFELADASFRGRQYGGYGDFRLRAVAPSGAPTHAFGRVIVTAQPGTRPLPVTPEPLTILTGAQAGPGSPIDFRWSRVPEAAGYVVDIQPFGADEPADHAFDPRDRTRCAAGPLDPLRPVRGIATEPVCRLSASPADAAGLYRWKVTALDARGKSVGGPSDWSFLVLAP